MVYKSNKPTKDGSIWYYRVYKKDIYGKNKQYMSKLYKTKKEAEEAERLYLLNKNNPIHVDFDLLSKEYLASLNEKRKLSTIYTYNKDYIKHIQPYFKGFYVDEINVSQINNWCLEMSKNGLSVQYMNKIYNILSNIFDYAMKYYGLDKNPVKIVGRFQENKTKIITDEEKIKYITFDEFQTFISVVDDPVDYALFNFLYLTGCRKSEAFALNWNDIDFKTSTIKINKALCQKIKSNTNIASTKNNQNRTIKMNKTLYDIMNSYYNSMKQYTNYKNDWFVFGNTKYYSQTTLDRHKDLYIEMSGCPYFTIHELRHSHVSLLINEYIKQSKEKNMKVDTAKFFLMMSNRMGHTIPVMTKTYMHLFPSVQDEIVDLLDNL